MIMIVNPVFLYDVSIMFEVTETLSASHGVCRHLYQLSATSNINEGELRHRTCRETVFAS